MHELHEKRLIGTLITEKPARYSFMLSIGVVLIMAVTSQAFWQNWMGLSEMWPAVQKQVVNHSEWWRLITAVFIHADIGHYLSNMYMLGIFGFFIYGYFGFRVFPLLTTVGAAFVNFLSILTYPPDVRLLGASGLVYVLGGWWLTMYFLIQRQYSYLNRSFRVVGTALMVFFPTTFVPTTSYRTHAIGFAIGIFMALLYFYLFRREIRSHEKYQLVSADVALYT